MLLRRSAAAIATLVTATVLAVPWTPAVAAAKPPVIGVADGTVGIAEGIVVSAPPLANTSVVVGLALGGVAQGQVSVPLGATGSGSVLWLPPTAGTWTASGTGALASAAPVTFAVRAVPTRTSLSTPNVAGSGPMSTNILTATVVATGGVLMPQGTVVVSGTDGTRYASGTLTGSAQGVSTATIPWAAPAPAGYQLVATYVPAGGNTVASTSSMSLLMAQATTPPLSLVLPTLITPNVPITIGAVVGDPTLGGTVAFLVNDNGVITYLGGSLNLTAGSASRAWTPPHAGNFLVTANYTALNGTPTASISQVIAARPVGAPDPMSVTVGGTAAGASVRVAAGTRTPVGTASGSGAPVNLTTSGPCVLAGPILVAVAKGSCLLAASSPGAGGYSPNTASFTVTVG